MQKRCCFKGRGHIAVVEYAALLTKTAGFERVGNAPELTVTLSETVERVPDYTNSAGGTDCTSRIIERAELAMTLMCHSAEVLAMALYGSGATGNVPSAAVVGEEHVAWPGALVPLVDVPDLAQPIAVTNVAGTTTYQVNVDYSITESGSILVLEGSTIPAPAIVAGKGTANIKVNYQRAEQSVVQLFTTPSRAVAFHFDGVNTVDGKPVQFRLFNVKFGPSQNVTLIGDNTSRLQMTGEIERDASLPIGTPAAPFSQYGTLRV